MEPIWSSGTLNTTPTSDGTWYLHLKGHNGADVANGTYDYAVTTGVHVGVDFDNDCDVDEDDYGLFAACFSGPAVSCATECADKDLDNDDDVDQEDFGRFQRCFSGKGPSPDPQCLE
jgi:hypothetical protein